MENFSPTRLSTIRRSALPQKTLRERGYKGPIYQTHGVANNDFLRICGKDCEGTLLPVGPVQMKMPLGFSMVSTM